MLSLFDLTIAATGATSASARRAGADFDAVVLTPSEPCDVLPRGPQHDAQGPVRKGRGV